MSSDVYSLPISAPEPQDVWRELRLFRELPRLGIQLPSLVFETRGRGRPVLLLPGYGSSDRALKPLSMYLRALGYRSFGWGLGKNRGDVPALVPQVAKVAERIADEEGRPVSLLGWSLGGVLARETARDLPEVVDRVITLGTPIVGGPAYTVLAERYRRRGFDLESIAEQVAERNSIPIDRPITAIYSRRDAIVAWQACIDRTNRSVENREVSSSHLGLTLDPAVFRIVARSLAA